ncbi:hypothetical protein [Schnuerera ultunensis]|uniref:Plasmid maintenance system killer protein n=1 Tax=[Clostridium] ultunense Esp TaxID=1288971 RepID=A0A1M4PLD9_9FIRM|nr:hypothetical protein [Schnuerera ultunensis]SHD76258.1 conserved protein of unknown function [[Clostridium] ultunense Esp]
MKVEYRTKKLKKQCEDPKVAQKDYGSNIGNKLTQRVGELIAATSLLDIKHIPSAGLHRLKGTRADEYAVNLAHPYRLSFYAYITRRRRYK